MPSVLMYRINECDLKSFNAKSVCIYFVFVFVAVQEWHELATMFEISDQNLCNTNYTKMEQHPITNTMSNS